MSDRIKPCRAREGEKRERERGGREEGERREREGEGERRERERGGGRELQHDGTQFWGHVIVWAPFQVQLHM